MISASAAVVAAIPIHGPLTRQMRSFGNLINASINCKSGLEESNSEKSCVKSFPELKRQFKIILY